MEFREDRAQSLPRIGEPAPQFEALTTRGKIRLEDFKGNWLVLFSHPADFTPVCTSEFIAFAEIQPRLREIHCELLGLSIDSVYSHIAWLRSIREKMGQTIDFPVIADLNKDVAALYGMVMPGESRTETVRCVFVMDERQWVRAMTYYPLNVGRNTDEIYRLVMALQAVDKHGVATPANWRPGEQIILRSPQTREEADERMRDKSLECRDWYYCKRDL